jgi:CubicO group peptidase (beta-lactamase class C family)
MSTTQFSKSGLDRMHNVMAAHVERGTVPGMVNLISRNGEVQVEALGEMAIGGGRAVRRDTIFRIASVTKPITAVAAMILIEECRLGLDDPVDDLLPELADLRVIRDVAGPIEDTVAAHRQITVRDVLTFRLGYGMIMEAWDGPLQQALNAIGQGPPVPSAVPAPDEWMSGLGAIPLAHQPGERWLYNTGSDVLGVLIARASGQPLDTFMRERIFAPLGMKDTGFHVPAESLDRLVTAYRPDAEAGGLVAAEDPAKGEFTRPPAFASGSGGLVSTVDDVLAFGQMMLGGGAVGAQRILSRASVETMTIDHLTEAQKARSGLVDGYFDSHGWGFGMSVVTRRLSPSEPVGQYGWDGGLGTTWANDPGEGLIGVQLTQVEWTSPVRPRVCRDFWTSAYAAIAD